MSTPAAPVLRISHSGSEKLPYLIEIPTDPPLRLIARSEWPKERAVFCLPAKDWTRPGTVVSEIPVNSCQRFGTLITVVINRAHDRRMTFRESAKGFWWNTARTAANNDAGLRIPMTGDLAKQPLKAMVDSRERWPYRFDNFSIHVERRTLAAGDYAVELDSGLAVVERKSESDFLHSITTGHLPFVMSELAGLVRAAVVVEARFPAVLNSRWCNGSHVADAIATMAVRYPNVPIVFAGSRPGGELWTARWLAAAYVELAPPAPSSAPLR